MSSSSSSSIRRVGVREGGGSVYECERVGRVGKMRTWTW